MEAANEKLFLYLIPTHKEFSTRLMRFYTLSLHEDDTGGENAAHEYLPHATLIEIVPQKYSSIEALCAKIKELITSCIANDAARGLEDADAVQIYELIDKPKFLGLALQSPVLSNVLASFQLAKEQLPNIHSIKTQQPDRLHISLASDFDEMYRPKLKQLLEECDLHDAEELRRLLCRGSWFTLALFLRQWKGQPVQEWMGQAIHEWRFNHNN